MVCEPSREKQTGDIGLRRSQTLSQCGERTVPVIESQKHTFKKDQNECSRGLLRVSVRDSTKQNVENTCAEEKEKQTVQQFDEENDHGERMEQVPGHVPGPDWRYAILLRCVSFYGLAADFDSCHVGVSASAVTTSRREIGEANFIDFGEDHFIMSAIVDVSFQVSLRTRVTGC
jgi:hypothetical protein